MRRSGKLYLPAFMLAWIAMIPMVAAPCLAADVYVTQINSDGTSNIYKLVDGADPVIVARGVVVLDFRGGNPDTPKDPVPPGAGDPDTPPLTPELDSIGVAIRDAAKKPGEPVVAEALSRLYAEIAAQVKGGKIKPNEVPAVLKLGFKEIVKRMSADDDEWEKVIDVVEEEAITYLQTHGLDNGAQWSEFLSSCSKGFAAANNGSVDPATILAIIKLVLSIIRLFKGGDTGDLDDFDFGGL